MPEESNAPLSQGEPLHETTMHEPHAGPTAKENASGPSPVWNNPLPLTISTIGDIFIERFLWTDPESTTSPGQLPYTAPEDLRTHDFTNTFVELSGSPLHADIYANFLKECEFTEQDYELDPVPGRNDIIELADNLLGREGNDHSFRDYFARSFSLDASFGPFPVYLHELSAYPAEDDPANKNKTVWRIKHSHGEVRAPKPREELIQRVSQAINTLHEHIYKWLDKRRRQCKPSVVVICDRNADKHTMRGRADGGASARSTFGKILTDKKSEINPRHLVHEGENDLLILWHTRSPLFPNDDTGALSRFLLIEHIAKRTIPIISDRCLREAGVKLRFDGSYESSFNDILSAQKHPVLRQLTKFPHVLIRFDYGVVHVTNHGGQAIGLDLHAFASGNCISRPARHGTVQGMTPLLVGAILREVVSSCANNGGAVGGVKQFLDDSCNFKHPTVLHNTPLDRAIDAAVLLWGLHYKRGYSDATGDIWFGAEEDVNAFTSAGLFQHLVGHVADAVPAFKKDFATTKAACSEKLKEVKKLLSAPAGERLDDEDEDHALAKMDEFLRKKRRRAKRPGGWLDDYLIVKHGSRLERLSRLSRPINGKPFSRAQLLRKRGVMVGGAGVPTLRASGSDVAAKENMRQQILVRIVKRGLEYVLQRPDLKATLIDDAGDVNNILYRFEPSVIVPNLQFGKMATVDPEDINSFLAVRNLVDKYLAADDWKNPLAIAVFGKPGSGKSTIVKKLLADVPNCELDPGLECNLSQWTSLDQLSLHFQKIQDRTLHTRKTQIVFFDEFDGPLGNEPVGWLKYFLMPLQDGMYMVRNDTFHFGKSIFVFAGGIAHTYADFLDKFMQQGNAKVPDFVSRLRAHIGVKDISLSELCAANDVASADDHAAQVRRSILLRDILLKDMKSIFDRTGASADISSSLIYALLNIPTFTHGVRSMQAIVQMSLVSGYVTSYKPSSLPTEEQLQMHVNAKEFMKLVRKYEMSMRAER